MYKTWLLHVVKYYPANRGPLIFLDKSIEGPLLTG